MAMLTETTALASGAGIPKIGFGTWPLEEGRHDVTMILGRVLAWIPVA